MLVTMETYGLNFDIETGISFIFYFVRDILMKLNYITDPRRRNTRDRLEYPRYVCFLGTGKALSCSESLDNNG